MSRSTVVSLKHFKMLDFLSKNKLLFILYFIFALGLIFGVVCFGKSSITKDVTEKVFNFLLSKKLNLTFISYFFTSLLLSFLILLFSFLLGASVMGSVTTPIFVIAFGFYYGCISSYLYSEFALTGIAYNAVIIIPSSVILIIAVIGAARRSFLFSLSISRLTFFNNRTNNVYDEFRTFCHYYFVVSAVLIVASLVDSILSKTLIGFFDFKL